MIKNLAVYMLTRRMKKGDEKLLKLKKDVLEVTSIFNMNYANDSKQEHMMDLYVPKNKAVKGVIVDVHGGAWIYGNKELNQHFCMHMAKRGYAVFNINYRLTPKVTLVEQVQDIFMALHYIQNHIKDYGYSFDEFILSGDSAGAHLIGLCACIMQLDDLQHLYHVKKRDLKIKALLLQHGIHSLKPMENSQNKYIKILMQWLIPDHQFINKNALMDFIDSSWNIPIFLLSSEADQMFCSQTKELKKTLDDLQVSYSDYIWSKDHQDLNHVFHISHPDKKKVKKHMI